MENTLLLVQIMGEYKCYRRANFYISSKKQKMSELIKKLTLLSKASNDDLEHFHKAPILPYHEKGISIADTAELKTIINDIEIYGEDKDESKFFIPIHAWRALAQVNPSADTIEFLLEFVKNPYLKNIDWFNDDFVSIIEAIGEPAIQPIDDLIGKNGDNDSCVSAIEGLSRIPKTHSGLTNQCIAVVSKYFANYAAQDESVNGFLLIGLLELKAALPNIDLIRAAFEADKIDEFCAGDLEDVEIELGLRIERTNPREVWDSTFLDDDDEEKIQLPNRTAPALSKKEKEKRKAKNKEAKKARKKNRKK